MGGCLLAINERNDMWMVEAFQDVDLGVQILFELLVKLLEVDRFDSYVAASLLFSKPVVSNGFTAGISYVSSTMEIGRNGCSSICIGAQVDASLSMTEQSRCLLTTCIALYTVAKLPLPISSILRKFPIAMSP